MKQLKNQLSLVVPEDVRVTVKSRKVWVKGPRGVLTRDFAHVAVRMFTRKGKDGQEVVIEKYWANRKALAAVRTQLSHIKNMITGVTKGFQYKMRMVYSHFKIDCKIENNGTHVSITNFIGTKLKREVPMFEGVVVTRGDLKDELILEGNSLDNVSQSAANIQQICRVCDKDIRKFLDGVYVSARGNISE